MGGIQGVIVGCCGGGRASGGRSPSQLPDLSRRLTNLALTVANVIAHALKTGQVKADTSTIERRVHACKDCRHLEKARCSVCGCYVTAKAGLKAEKCPLGKW
jgi:hypothetical protein